MGEVDERSEEGGAWLLEVVWYARCKVLSA